MTLWAVVPVKPFRHGKSRLSPVLSEDERVVLNRGLLENSLEVLNSIAEIEHILVVSHDPYVLAISRNYRALTFQESGQMGLNIALQEAARVVKSYKANSLLILPADLPLLDPQDIRTMVTYVREPPVVVIAPDRHQDGTNALILSPIGCIPFAYGNGSFARHSELAQKAGVRLEICSLPSLSIDIDLPEDLELVRKKYTDEVT